jgi:hypothetical protein
MKLGGKNEWSGGDAQSGSPVLRVLSHVHSRARFPNYVEQWLRKTWNARHAHRWKRLILGVEPFHVCVGECSKAC